MAVRPDYLAYILEQLEALPAVRPNRMFGGVGLYSDGLFFGLIDDDTLFFKTGASNVEEYRARNMPKFMPFPDRPEAVLGYHQVPADVIEDAETLVAWARNAVAVALEAQSRKASKPRATSSSGKTAARRKPLAKRKATAKRQHARKPKPVAKNSAARVRKTSQRGPARKK